MIEVKYKHLSVICILFLSIQLKASSYDYKYPHSSPDFSNYGTIGLIQNPSSRFLSGGSLALSWIHFDPYLRGSLVAYPFDWFEASFQYTDINNALYSEFSEFSGSQSLKDKSFDAKFLLLKEQRFLPQIAVGFRDLGGTGLFSSEYIVANKFLSENLDLSFGLGWGNLNGNKINNPFKYISNTFEERFNEVGRGGEVNINSFFSGDAGYFGGMEYYLPGRKLRFKLEFDGTNYETESRIPLVQNSKINYGFTYAPSNNFTYRLFYSRGDTLNFGFSYKFDFSSRKPTQVAKDRPASVDNIEIVRRVTSRSNQNLFRASLLYLGNNDINLQKASIKSDDKLEVIYSQSKYRFPLQSAGRALRILDDISPKNIKSFRVAEINGGLGVYELEIDRDNFRRYEKLNAPEVAYASSVVKPYSFNEFGHDFNPKSKYPVIFTSFSPELQSQIGGPDGFFFGDLKLKLESEVLFKRNLSLINTLNYGLVNNFDDLKLGSNSILPHVRTDIVDYLKNSTELSITRMQLNYYNKIGDSTYFKISGGIFEMMFSGYGIETLYRPFYQNYGIGFEIWKAYQREYDQLFALRKYNTLTGHLTFYYEEPKTNILFQIKGGKYLAGDSGFTFDFSRSFKSGFRVGAYFSVTDISSDEFGEGSFDKGFYFWIPLDLFSQFHTRRNFGWGLRPITRDGAQFLIHGYPLWGVTNMSNIKRFQENVPAYFE